MKNFLQRTVCLVLVLFLMSGSALAANEKVFDTGEITLKQIEDGEKFYLESAAVLGDTVYGLFNNGEVLSFVAGETKTPVTLGANDYGLFRLAAGDGNLYGFNRDTGDVFLITKDNAERIATVDLTKLPLEWSEFISPFVIQGKLYMMITLNWDGDYALLSFDLSTSNVEIIKIQGIQAICPYKDDTLLVARLEGSVCILSQVDPTTFAVTDLDYAIPHCESYTSQMCMGLAYAKAQDTLYYIYDGRLFFASQGQPFQGSATLPSRSFHQGTQAFALKDGRYAYVCDGVNVVDAATVQNQKTLTISNQYPSETLYRFMEAYKDIPIVRLSESLSASDISQRILGGDTQVDIYEVLMDGDATALKQKGFMASMGDSAAITEAVNDLYPFAKAVATDANGQPVCYPSDCYQYLWSCIPSIFKTYFGDTPLPETYLELFDMMLTYEQDFAADHPEHEFIEWFDYERMVAKVITAYAWQYEDPDFQGPILKQTLEKLAKVQAQRLINGQMDPMDYQLNTEVTEYFGLFSMASYWGFLTNTEDESSGTLPMLPLVFEKGETPVIPCKLKVLFINPNSQNKEAALQYIEYAANEKNDFNFNIYYSLRQSAKSPYLYESAKNRLAEYQIEVDRWQEALDLADEGDKRDIQAKLDEAVADYERYEKSSVRISKGGIENYQASVSMVTCSENSPYLSYREDAPFAKTLSALASRYAAGQLNLDGLLAEINRTVKKMDNERMN